MRVKRFLPLIIIAALVVGMTFLVMRVPGKGDDIQVASIKGDTTRVEKLLRYNGNYAREKTYHGYTPLHWAAMGGHTRIAEMLIANGADVNATSEERVTPLFLAAKNGHKDIVEILLKHGAKVDVKADYVGFTHGKYQSSNCYQGCTALFVASENGYTDIVKILLDCGANIHATGYDGMTVLQYAVGFGGNRKVIEILLRHGANAKITDKAGNTLINVTRDQSIIKLLKVHGAEVSTKVESNNGQGIALTGLKADLFKAINNKDTARARTIIGLKPSLANARDIDGQTPLHEAAINGDSAMVKLLLDTGANMDVVHDSDCTPFRHALLSKDLVTVKLFLDRMENKPLPKDCLSDATTLAITKLLLAHGAKLGFNKDKLLLWAAEVHNKDLVEFYISKGASPNAKGNGFCALSLALGSGFLDYSGTQAIDTAKALVSHGADVNAHNYNGISLLHTLSINPQPYAIDFLLSHGADVNARTNVDETPLDLANDPDTIRSLLLYGAKEGSAFQTHKQNWLQSIIQRLSNLFPHP